MEKLFFKISKLLMLIGATFAFIFLIIGSIYAIKLYIISEDKYVEKNIYNAKHPTVTFDTYKNMYENKISQQKKIKKEIESYVLNVIQKGSKGHGYPMGNMPPNLIKDKSAKKDIASFVANKLKGAVPRDFGVCATCHGEDGEGLNGMAPSLTILPIYNGLIKPKNDIKQNMPQSKNIKSRKRHKDRLKKYSAKITSIINKYALIVGQDGTTVDIVYDFLKRLRTKYDIDTFSIFKTQLRNNLNKLLNYGKNLSKDNNAINWKDFVEWFIDNFDQQLQKEQNKYQLSLEKYHHLKNAKLSKAMEAQLELYQVGIALGIALVIFVLLTMILVLFQIEINTRPKEINREIKE